MKYGALFGWGIVIYAVMYLVLQILAIQNITGTIAHALGLLTLVVVTTIAGRSLKFRTWSDIIPYSLFWMLVVIAIDALVTLPIAGTSMYTNWQIWAGYALVAVFPLVAPYTQHHDQIQ